MCPWHLEDTPSFIYNPKTYSYHCFRGDTKVITKHGVKPIENLVGSNPEIINGNGEWERTSFHFCGLQKIYKLTLISKGKQKEIYTTGDHEWIVQEKSHKIQTRNLKKGMRLDRKWVPIDKNLVPSKEGLQHGFMYGDGSFDRHNKRENIDVFTARICTNYKLEFCKTVFEKLLPPSPSELKEIPQCAFGRTWTKSKKNLKEVPPLTEPIEYLYGFLIGYFVADGNCSDNSAAFLSSSRNDLEKIKDICTLVGIPTYPIGSSTRKPNKSNMGVVTLKTKHTMYTLRMVKSAVTKDFFVGAKRIVTPNQYSSYLGYKVFSVKETEEVAPVYCCETSTGSFVLEDFILTGNCFSCSRNTDIIDAYMHTGLTFVEAVQKLFEEAKILYSFGEVGVKTKRQYAYPHEEPSDDKEQVYEYLAARMITKETADAFDVRQDRHGNIVFNYYDTNDVLTMVKYRPSHKIDKKAGDIKCWCQKDADTTPLLFNMNRINIGQPLAITEGELDAMALYEAGVTNVVSVPFGAANYNWITENFDWLEQFDSIIICSDNDEAGVKMRNECVYRLGSWRTKFVEIPKIHTNPETGREYPMKDINEVLYYEGKQAVIDLIVNAKDVGVPSVLDLSDVTDVDLDEMDGITTGIKDIDAELMRLFYGTLTILSGQPGAGKTSFISQLVCQALEQDKNVWMFSREMPSWMTKSWLNYIMAGGNNVREYKDYNGAKYYKVTPEAKKEISESYRGKWFVYKDDASNKLEDLLVSMQDSVRKYGTKLLILDNLMTIDLGSNENNAMMKQTEAINKLIVFAMQFSVAIVLVAHPRKMPRDVDVGIYDISGTANIANLAHRTLGLKRIRENEPNSHDVTLTIIKDRMRGKAGKHVDMYYDTPTRRFYTNEDEYNYQYAWDHVQHPPLPYPHLEEMEVYGDFGEQQQNFSKLSLS